MFRRFFLRAHQKIDEHVRPRLPAGANSILILVIVSFFTLACHLTTVKNYPLSWLDEVDIIETGRYSTYDQHPVWAMNLQATHPATPPTPLIHYFGGFIQETLYRSTGSFVVPRVFAVFGLIFAVSLFYVWLRKKGFQPWITLFVALLLLSDTNVTVGVHWYRLDMWVMGLTFLNALLVLRCAGEPESMQRKRLLLVGGIMVFQMFFWFTAVIQWPLVLAEVLALAWDEKWTFRRYGQAALAGWSGMLIACAVMLIPLYGELPKTLHNFFTQTEVGSMIHRMNPSMPENPTGAFLSNAFDRSRHFFMLILRTPFIWFGAAIGCCFWRRHPFHVAALLLCSGVVIMTQVYHARVNYLTPLAFLLFAEGLSQCLARTRLVRYFAIAFLMLALAYSFGLSVVGLNYFARPLSRENSYDALLQKMTATIGRGPRKVYTFTYDVYHVGRKLGWHMFSFLPGTPEALFVPAVSDPLLARLEYIVVGDDYALTYEQEAFLKNHGFCIWQRIELPADAPTGITARFRPIIYARGYPSFAIWRKTL